MERPHATAAMTDHSTSFESGKNKSNENFPVGSFLIRADLRPHVFAFYDFARAADDISDHPLLDPKEKVAKLEAFAVTLLDDKNNDVPEAIRLRQSLRETKVSPQHSLDILTAFKRDATQLRYSDWYDLIDYCNFSAAPVGRHVLALHGIGSEVWSANDALCNALQIINHIQDCADDYRELDRVYIPQDLLAAHGAHTEDLSKEKSSPALRSALDAMLEKLAPLMKDASVFPSQIPDFRLRAETSVIYTLAERLFSLLKKRDPLCDNIKLGKAAILEATLTGTIRSLL